jgi:hypothetical protein
MVRMIGEENSARGKSARTSRWPQNTIVIHFALVQNLGTKETLFQYSVFNSSSLIWCRIDYCIWTNTTSFTLSRQRQEGRNVHTKCHGTMAACP